MSRKVTVIGGGSSMFVPVLLRQILTAPSLRGGTVCLMDVDSDRLEPMVALARALARAEDPELTVESSTDRRTALAGADFVIVAISVGGMDAWERDIEIPGRHGIFMQIADSIGPGGIARALRHVPILQEICRDVAELCPEAWVINYTNPASVNTMAMQSVPGVRSVSLCSCISYLETPEWIEAVTGVDPEDLMLPPVVGGINHCAGITELRRRDGSSVLPPEGRTEDALINFGLDRYGILPYCSKHWAEFFPQLQQLDEPYQGRAQGLMMKRGLRIYDMQEQRGRVRRWQELAARWSEPEHAAEVSLANLPPGDEDRGITVGAVMEALSGGERGVFVVNTRNGGSIPNLPESAVVEVNAMIDGYGVHPLQTSPLHPALAAHLSQHVAVQRLTLTAALGGRRDDAVLALLHDPLVAARLEAELVPVLADEILEANAAHLPRFS
jgi:alpha-galactosidase